VIVQPEGWPRGVGYAHGVAARGTQLCIAGQIGWDPGTREFVAADFAGQAAQALANVATVLAAAGGRPEDLVSMRWYITDRDAYARSRRDIGVAYRGHFGTHYPAMAVVVVAGLIEVEALVEIEAIAVLPDRASPLAGAAR
jgi:enamine deaminase RidA (YjgF/YER057c/UK114 family)